MFKKFHKFLPGLSFGLISVSASAQGVGGIERGASTLNTLTGALEAYIDPVTTVIYVVAAIIGLIGALRIYNNWQAGKDNVWAGAVGWFGAMLFILIANTVLRAMFIG